MESKGSIKSSVFQKKVQLHEYLKGRQQNQNRDLYKQIIINNVCTCSLVFCVCVSVLGISTAITHEKIQQ